MVYKWGVINRKASMIHEFMYPHEAWFASWNIQDLSSSLSLCENLKISKKLCTQNNYLKSSLLYTWSVSLLNSVHELWARPPPPFATLSTQEEIFEVFSFMYMTCEFSKFRVRSKPPLATLR